MKLTPKVKPIRIRILSGEEEHSTMDSLRNNFSFKDILPLVKDGRLCKWLYRVGEKEVADRAKILIGHELSATSKEVIELTAWIFKTEVQEIEDLQKLWLSKYQKTFLNYVKYNVEILKDLESARVAYDLHNTLSQDSIISSTEWQNIFVNVLKKNNIVRGIELFQ